jgi:NAD(P)-dependent dehydrogenase (short-subunit alcohol dehydrogenase family)
MSQKAIFITGAGAGIGRATAELFAARGWRVGLYDRDEASVLALRQQLGEGSAIAGRLDVTDAEALRLALESFCKNSGGRLDVMFNNAGIAHVGEFESIPITKSHAIVDVNLKGVINGAYAALPHLQRTPGARMISMCSASAIYGAAQFAVYSSTKFAVRGFTEALDIEWSRYGIRVMDVSPLFVATPMVSQFADQPPKSMSRLGLRLTAEDIAAAVWRLSTRPGWLCPLHCYPGAQTKFLAATSKITPFFLNRYINRLIQS